MQLDTRLKPADITDTLATEYHYRDCLKQPTVSLLARKKYESFNYPGFRTRNEAIINSYPEVKALKNSVEPQADNFPKNYTNIVEALKGHGITDTQMQDKIIAEVFENAFIGKANPRLMKICRKVKNGLDISADEMMYLQIEAQKLINSNKCNNSKFIQSVYKDVETLIKKGVFTQDAIIEHICK